MEHGLLVEISPLLEWNKLHLMVSLWDVLSISAVSGTRTQRLGTLNRVLCLKGHDWGRDEDPEKEESDEELKADETPFATLLDPNF